MNHTSPPTEPMVVDESCLPPTAPNDRLVYIQSFRDLAGKFANSLATSGAGACVEEEGLLTQAGVLFKSALEHGYFQSLPGTGEILDCSVGKREYPIAYLFLDLIGDERSLDCIDGVYDFTKISRPTGLLPRLYPDLFVCTDYRSMANSANGEVAEDAWRLASAQADELRAKACWLLADTLEREHAEEVGQGQSPQNEAVWLSGGRVRVGDQTIQLEEQEADVLQALVETGAAAGPELVERSGRSDAVRILKSITSKHSMLAPYISRPGARGRGGYKTTIKSSNRQ